MKKILLFSLSLYLFIASSCNDGNKTNDANPSASITNNSIQSDGNSAVDTTAKANLLDGNFPHLLMGKKEIYGLLKRNGSQEKGKKKIVFLFRIMPMGPSPLLIGFGTKKIDDYILSGVDLEPSGLSTRLSGEMIFGNLELSRKQFINLLAAPSARSFTHLHVIPFLENRNGKLYVNYKVSLVTASKNTLNGNYVIDKTFSGEELLNPCPPKKPCGLEGNVCDDDDGDPEIDQ